MNFAPLFLLLSLLPLDAYAYVDPGAGMLVWQGLVAGVGMLIMFFRHRVESVKRFLGRFRRK